MFLFSLVTVGTVFALSVWMTSWMREYALRRGVSDIPNERSLHSVPTPRGGGLAIAATFFAATAVLAWEQLILSNLAWALIGGGGLVSWIGWRDDRQHVAIQWRLLVHVAAAVWALFWLGGVEIFGDGKLPAAFTWLDWALAALGIVWATNLYNFMDGSDGLASAQALCAASAAGFLLCLNGAFGVALTAFSLAAASAGFLVWNWPRARIFMGDVGSGLLGFIFAVLALGTEQSGDLPLTLWLLLLAVFILDTGYTLAARILRGEKWYAAHRSHTYQRLIQAGYSHRQVLWGLIGVNVIVLWPLAMLGWSRPAFMPIILLAVAVSGWAVWRRVQQHYPAS